MKKQTMTGFTGGGASAKLLFKGFCPDKFKKSLKPFWHFSPTAFTLAEVLITLGIVGIVAAMTLPAVINKSRGKILESQFKKNYTLLQQSLLVMYREEGQEINKQNYTREVFCDKFVYYINNTNKTRAGAYTSSVTSEENSSGKIYTIKNYRTYTDKQVEASHLDDGLITFNDGRRMYLDIGLGTDKGNNLLLTIDINGVQNKPNRWGN